MEQTTRFYDLIILGGGPAGYFAAERASDGGLRTLVIEERELGGVCLNEGCIPTKSLLYSAKVASSARHGEEFGVFCENVKFDHAKAVERKNAVVRKLVGGVTGSLKQKKIDVIRARGVCRGRGEIGFGIEANGESFEGARLLICTGSSVIVPHIAGVQEALTSGLALTSREILDLDTLPSRLVIVGGGVIGLELANYFVVAGSEVVVVEMLPEVGGQLDSDIARTLRCNLEKLGVRFLLETKAIAFEAGGVRVSGVPGGAVADELLLSDRILISIGRSPRTKDAGFESLGLHTEGGALVTDAHMRTNVAGVWAAGDVTGKSMLAHTAYREAAVCVNDMLGISDAMSFDAIPQIIYTSPEAAGVGETESSAAEKGYVFDKVVVPLAYSGRYVSENVNGDGFVKVISERNTGRALGIHIIGSYASEIILAAAVMVGSKWSGAALERIIYPHPTVGEVLRDAFFEIKRK